MSSQDAAYAIMLGLGPALLVLHLMAPSPRIRRAARLFLVVSTCSAVVALLTAYGLAFAGVRLDGHG